MPQQYAFQGSEQVTVILSPTLAVQEQEVTAQALKSGVIFTERFDLTSYGNADEVAAALNALAGRFDSWSAVTGVVSITTGEDINAQNQLANFTEITVQSTSGKSTTVFRYVYPVGEFNTLPAFLEQVNKWVGYLNAVEGE
jgi:hypothetical protein